MKIIAELKILVGEILKFNFATPGSSLRFRYFCEPVCVCLCVFGRNDSMNRNRKLATRSYSPAGREELGQRFPELN